MPADKPVIRDLSAGSARQVEHLIGPHDEGSKVVLECETQGGYPEPMLSWWRNGRLVDDTYEIVSALDGSLISEHRGVHQLSGSPVPGAHLLDGGGGGPTASSTGDTGGSGQPPFGGEEQSEGAISEEESFSAPAKASGSPPESVANKEAKQEAGGTGGKLVGQNRLIRNRLEVSAITRADLLANYSCQAWNTKLSEPPTSFVMIDVNRK